VLAILGAAVLLPALGNVAKGLIMDEAGAAQKKTQKAAAPAPAPPAPAPPWAVTYHDGSGNGFRVRRGAKDRAARFEYEPVRPENSSTGMYSGGEPRKGRLSAKAAEEMWGRVRALEAQTALRAPSRDKGTGAFRLEEPGKAGRDFLVKRGEPLRAFEDWLRAQTGVKLGTPLNP